MKVAFGTTLLDRGLVNVSQDGIDGIGQYCQALLSEFQTITSTNSPIIAPFSFNQKTSLCGAHVFPHYYLHPLHSSTVFSKNNFFNQVDVVHSTDQFIPICNKPLVATVMDVIPLSHPQFIKTHSRHVKSFFWKFLTTRANKVITISNFSKSEILKYMNFSEEDVNVIPLGVSHHFFKNIDSESRKLVLTKYGISTPFFLFIGSIQPRKNILRLIHAHSRLPQKLAWQFPLVIAGKWAWSDPATQQAINHAINDRRVIWLKYISDYEKTCLLQSAAGMPFVSLYEGFGLPILEAFASRLPVITSHCSAIPEIAHHAAILVNPENTQEITDALKLIIERSSDIEQQIEVAYRRSKEFSWENTAVKTIEIYQSLM